MQILEARKKPASKVSLIVICKTEMSETDLDCLVVFISMCFISKDNTKLNIAQAICKGDFTQFYRADYVLRARF